MDPSEHRSRQGCEAEDRKDESRAAVVAQMMEENREGLGMKVIAIMVQRWGVLPRELWDLNSISDMGAGRGVTYYENVPRAMFEGIISNTRYTVVDITLSKDVPFMVELPPALLQLKILASTYDYLLDLPVNLLGLVFGRECKYDKRLSLPVKLRKLVLSNYYNKQMKLPPNLIELELGVEYNRPLTLPQLLQRLTFSETSQFDRCVALPPSLVALYLGESYNQPTTLPNGLEELRVGQYFTYDLCLPNSLRKIEWCCNRPIQIPDGVSEVKFSRLFNQEVTLPANLKKATFCVSAYSHTLNFPTGLEDLIWRTGNHADLVLPEGLHKLTWESGRNVTLPSGLKELVVEGNAPLVLPEGLLKVVFSDLAVGQYNLPESVQEVVLQSAFVTFTHPTILNHLILSHKYATVNWFSNKIHKLTIDDGDIVITQWPQEPKELAFTVHNMRYPLLVPRGCSVVGEKQPGNVVME